ncbi:MAG: hypothetical protein IJW54_06250 [Clostridia bacterium]|nr:hypothetical protein [Clostridia bacterium]
MTEQQEKNEIASIMFSKLNGADFDDVNDAACELHEKKYRRADKLLEKVFNKVFEIIDDYYKKVQDTVKDEELMTDITDYLSYIDSDLREYKEELIDDLDGMVSGTTLRKRGSD